MSDKLKKAVDDLVEQRKLSLVGLEVDILYFENFLKENKEDEIRDELSIVRDQIEEENKKIERDENKKPVKDNRDHNLIMKLDKKVNDLNAKIDKITETKQDKLKYEEMREDIKKYITLLTSLEPEFVKKLEEILE